MQKFPTPMHYMDQALTMAICQLTCSPIKVVDECDKLAMSSSFILS